MPKALNLTGQKFGLLTAIATDGKEPQGTYRWRCLCDCGTETVIRGASLRSGNTLSCGCVQRERAKDSNTTHGAKGTPTYLIWKGMMRRGRSNYHESQWYYDLGVRVCPRWHFYENFLADMGPRPDGMSIDRYPNPAGNYEPGNCRWATAKQQAHNRRPKP